MTDGRARVWLQVALFVGLLGMPDGALGVLWPSLRATFERPVGDLWMLAAAGTALYVAGSVLTGAGARRFGQGGFVAGATVTAVAGYALWLLSPAWLVVIVAVAATGFARGAVDAAANADAALASGAATLGLIHASYGLGATAAPLLATPLLRAAGWRGVVALLVAVSAACAAAAVRLRGRWDTPAAADGASAGAGATTAAGATRDPRPAGQAEPAAPTATPARARRGVLGATLLAFVVYVAVETSVGAWAFSVLREGRGVGLAWAGPLTASYWGALTAGRVLLWAGGRRAGARLLHASALLALGGLVLFWGDPFGAGAVGLAVTGLGFGPIFPLLVALIPARLGAARATSGVGLAVGASSLGGPLGAAGIGALANRGGLAAVPAAFVAMGCALVLVEFALGRVADGPRRAANVA